MTPADLLTARRAAEEVQALIDQAAEVLRLHLVVHEPAECTALHAVRTLLAEAEDRMSPVMRVLWREADK